MHQTFYTPMMLIADTYSCLLFFIMYCCKLYIQGSAGPETNLKPNFFIHFYLGGKENVFSGTAGKVVIVHYDSLTVSSSVQGGETLLDIYTPTRYSVWEEDGDFSYVMKRDSKTNSTVTGSSPSLWARLAPIMHFSARTSLALTVFSNCKHHTFPECLTQFSSSYPAPPKHFFFLYGVRLEMWFRE